MSELTRLGARARPVEHSTSTERDPVFWDIKDVEFHCRIGRSTAWRLVREADFPAPVVLGRRTLVWPRAEVLTFIEDKRDPDHYATPVVEERSSSFTLRPSRRRVS